MTRQACMLAAFTLLVVSGTAWPLSSSTSSEESRATPDTMAEYRVIPLPPRHTDEDGNLTKGASTMFCSLFLEGTSLEVFMLKYAEDYFGEDVVFEEMYPHIRCHQLDALPLDLPRMDYLRLIIERPEYSINFLVHLMSYFHNHAKYPEFLGKVLSCRVKYHEGCMDYIERINERISYYTRMNNGVKRRELLTKIRAFLLKQTPVAGPIERDVRFCQEILHEPLACRDSSIFSDRLSLIAPLHPGDFFPSAIEAGPRCVPL